VKVKPTYWSEMCCQLFEGKCCFRLEFRR